MEKFWKALETELFARGMKTTPANCVIDSNYNFHINDLGNYNDSLCRHLYLFPSKDIAHSIDVDEIWTGFDCDGEDWSDNMGGLRIDCSGLNRSNAIKKIADKITEHWNEYFA